MKEVCRAYNLHTRCASRGRPRHQRTASSAGRCRGVPWYRLLYDTTQVPAMYAYVYIRHASRIQLVVFRPCLGGRVQKKMSKFLLFTSDMYQVQTGTYTYCLKHQNYLLVESRPYIIARTQQNGRAFFALRIICMYVRYYTWFQA